MPKFEKTGKRETRRWEFSRLGDNEQVATQGHATDEQLTLEQHAFELRWSADLQMIFNGVSAPPPDVVQGSVVSLVSGMFASPFCSSCPKFPEFSLPRTDPPVPLPVSESFNSFPLSTRKSLHF